MTINEYDELEKCYQQAQQDSISVGEILEYLFDNTDGIDEEDVLEFFDNCVINN